MSNTHQVVFINFIYILTIIIKEYESMNFRSGEAREELEEGGFYYQVLATLSSKAVTNIFISDYYYCKYLKICLCVNTFKYVCIYYT